MIGTRVKRGSWLGVVAISRRLVEGFNPYQGRDYQYRFCLYDKEITYEPSPSTSLDAGSSSVELLLQVVQATKRLDNGVVERARGKYSTVTLLLGRRRGKVLPEKRVVNVSCNA